MAKLVHCLGILAAFSQGVVSIADYSMDSQCGSSINFMSTTQIRLRLTNDYQYDNNMICKLNLHTTGGYNLLVHFVRMEIEYKLDCGYDFLTIYDGPSMSSPILTSNNRLCGSVIPHEYTSSGNDLTFYFQSDGSGQLSGFEVIITPFLQPGDCDASWMYKFRCENGRCISSDMTCSGYNPCGDYSDCPDTPTTPATPAPTTDTYQFSQGVVSIPNYSMDSQCGSTINLTLTTQIRLRLTNDYPYDNNMICKLSLHTTGGFRLLVHFVRMDIEYKLDCGYDFLTIYDGPSASSPFLTCKSRGDCDASWMYKFRCENGRCISSDMTCSGYNPCGDYSDCPDTPTTPATPAPTTDTYQFSQGVVSIPNYSMDSHCGSSINFMSTTQIRLRLTNDYQYDNNMICKLNLHTTGGFRLLVHFVWMEIQYKLDCGYDFLTIYDGPSASSPFLTFDNRLCGSVIPHEYTSSGNDLTFYFQSDSSSQLSGFEVIITPFLQPGECDASWMNKFICENGRCISSGMACSGYNPCGDYSDCPERSSRATSTPATPAPTNHTYPFSQGVVAIPTYSMDSQCGSSINITSIWQIRLRLTNDYKYDNNMICKLNLHVSFPQKHTTGGYRLLVHFVRMEIEYKLDCGYDFLTIYDGPSASSPFLTFDNRLCGSVIPHDYTSSGNDLTFYFQSDASTQLSGFEVIITPFLQPGVLVCDVSWFSFLCENGRCISYGMTCSGYNPCGDYSDCHGMNSRATATPATPAPITHSYYDPCSLSDCSMHSVSVGATILIVVGVIVVLIIVVVAGVLLRRRRRAPVQRNQTMGVATIPLPTTNMYAQPPPYAQLAHLGSQQSLQQNNTQPPPYTAMAPAMGRPNAILFPPATRVALSQSPATPLPVSDTTQNSKSH